jgi:plastocyanin
VYQWWVFVHLIGVLAFVAAHGVSMSVLLRLRTERDPQRVNHLLELSSSSITAFYYGLLLLLTGGIVAGFLGHWWGRAWIWAAIGILVLVTLVMYAVATPYYKRVRFVARAMAEGSKAVTPEQFDQVLRGGAPVAVGAVGVLGLLAIVYLMVLKPALGFSTEAVAPVPPGSGAAVQISAQSLQFHPTDLTAPAGQAFTLAFRNDDAGVPHNVAIYTDSSASSSVFVGAVFSGPATQNYQVPALQAGSYFFRCDVHPQMTGTITAGGGAANSPTPSSIQSG